MIQERRGSAIVSPVGLNDVAVDLELIVVHKQVGKIRLRGREHHTVGQLGHVVEVRLTAAHRSKHRLLGAIAGVAGGQGIAADRRALGNVFIVDQQAQALVACQVMGDRPLADHIHRGATAEGQKILAVNNRNIGAGGTAGRLVADRRGGLGAGVDLPGQQVADGSIEGLGNLLQLTHFNAVFAGELAAHGALLQFERFTELFLADPLDFRQALYSL